MIIIPSNQHSVASSDLILIIGCRSLCTPALASPGVLVSPGYRHLLGIATDAVIWHLVDVPRSYIRHLSNACWFFAEINPHFKEPELFGLSSISRLSSFWQMKFLRWLCWSTNWSFATRMLFKLSCLSSFSECLGFAKKRTKSRLGNWRGRTSNCVSLERGQTLSKHHCRNIGPRSNIRTRSLE